MATGSSSVTLPEGYTEETPSQAAPQTSSGGLPEGYTLEQPGQTSTPDQSGQVTNDVGQQVIVPKDGESYHDTIQRAVALGKQRIKEGSQQAAIDAETKTIPAKTAETLGGAAAMGAGGAAALAMPGEIAEFAMRHLAKNVLPELETFAPEEAKKTVMEMLPKAVEFAKTWGSRGVTADGLYSLFKSLMGDSKKK